MAKVLLNGDIKKAYASGACIEIYHNASLIFDDIQDNAEVRRYAPTMHVSTDLGMAMSIGAIVRSLMYEPLNNADVFSDQEQNEFHRVLDEACIMVARGQGQEVLWTFENRWDISTKEYYEMIAGKTGALFQAAFRLGAMCGTENTSTIKELADIGLQFGTLFQLKNDYLDIFGSEGGLKRPKYEDLREGKRTFVTLISLQYLIKNEPKSAKKVIEILSRQQRTERDVEQILQYITKTAIRKIVDQELLQRYDRLNTTLINSSTIPSSLKDELRDLSIFIQNYGA